jgi:ribonuclease HII
MLKWSFSDVDFEAGCDEAGRGCLAGPVTAAAVILPKITKSLLKKNDRLNHLVNHLNDSKQLNEKNRFELRPIIEQVAMSFAVVHISHEEIDEINILNASLKGMQECLLQLKPLPNFVIIDGNRPLIPKRPFLNKTGKIFSQKELDVIKSMPNKSIIKGDAKYLSIAAASILAKTYRDDFMHHIHQDYPIYDWHKNKGYPSPKHRALIAEHGMCEYHRKTFKNPANTLTLF